MDVNKPIENSQLLDILERLKSNYSYMLEHEFFEELNSAYFLTPVTEDSQIGCATGEAIVKEDTTIKFIHLSDDYGHNYIPAFTDWNELRKWNDAKNIRTLILSFNDYKNLVFSAESTFEGFVLNPFGNNILFDKDLIREVEDSVDEAKQGEAVMLGIPEKYPVQMIDALKEFLPSLVSVKSAYLLLMIREEDDKSLLLIVDTDGDYNNVFGKIADIAVNYLESDETLDIIPLAEEFGKNAVEGHSPFYQK